MTNTRRTSEVVCFSKDCGEALKQFRSGRIRPVICSFKCSKRCSHSHADLLILVLTGCILFARQ